MSRTKESTFKETKGKVTFVMFQVEGDDETLQQGFRAMDQAFQRLSVSPRLAPLPVGPAKLGARSENAADIHVVAETPEHELAEDQLEEADSEPDDQRSNNPRNHTQPDSLADLVLSSDKG